MNKTRIHTFPDVHTNDDRNTITATVDMWDRRDIPDRFRITVTLVGEGRAPWLIIESWPGMNWAWPHAWTLSLPHIGSCKITADLLRKIADAMDALDNTRIGVDE